ncbi:MAG: hypothetical protein LBV32_03190 [Tannerellaceae bacterium]|jgi:hypothetical protein|nr:hypothetical protein [Tannerellaceae bacterium]
MIKRYSHTAIITAEIGGYLRHGEWVEGSKQEFTVRGQYFPNNSGHQKKVNTDGNEFTVKGEFSTQQKKIEGATRIRIDSIGLDSRIESWEQFQVHSVIYI